MGGDHTDEHAHDAAPGAIWIYDLADPGLIAESETILRRALFEVLGVSDAARHSVSVSASSGWLTYHDRGGVWRPEPSPSLPTAAQARARGDKFLRDVVAAIARHRADLAPAVQNIGWMPQARPAELFAVPRPDGMAFDHWLYRLVPRLPAARGQAAIEVYGAVLELRIDPVGTIVSYQARWRPPTGRRVARAYKPFVAPPAAHGSHHGAKAPPPVLVYYQEGDRIPQVHLSPYHVFQAGHVLGVSGASDMSLVVELVPKAIPDGLEVWAVVTGGSGRARFVWAYQPADDIFDEPTVLGVVAGRTLTPDDGPPVAACKVRLPAGNHVVMVNVEDAETGAIKHYAELISNVPRVDGGAPLVA